MDGNGQIFRNALVHHIERQVAAEDFPLQPQDMDTVAGPDRYGTDLPLLNVEKESLEFRHRLTFGQLSEIAALLRRRAVGMLSRQIDEMVRILSKLGNPALGLFLRSGIGRFVVRMGRVFSAAAKGNGKRRGS